MTAWWQRPKPELPPWQPREGHTYKVGDGFAFDVRDVGRWSGAVIEVTPNGWLRIRIDDAPGLFSGLENRVMAGPLWRLKPE